MNAVTRYGQKPRDRIGEHRGLLTLLCFHHRVPGPKGPIYWSARCACGVEIVLRLSGRTRSCGCLQKRWAHTGVARRSHNRRHTREYDSWAAMKQRCLNQNNPKFPEYGGRGITICARWKSSFANFFADPGERPTGTTLGRINNDGDYTPANTRWESPKQQASNRRSLRRSRTGRVLPS